jgi:hypothetical protein
MVNVLASCGCHAAVPKPREAKAYLGRYPALCLVVSRVLTQPGAVPRNGLPIR